MIEHNGRPRGRWAIIRARHRREAILETAWEVFKERGYDGATLEEIADRLMMTKANLYYYVKSKADLLLECHRVAIAQVLAGLRAAQGPDDPPTDRLRTAVRNHIELVNESTLLAAVLLRHDQHLTPEVREEILRARAEYEAAFLEILDHGVAAGVFEIPDRKIGLFTILGALNWVSQWYRDGGPLSRTEVADRVADHLLQGILAQKSGPAGAATAAGSTSPLIRPA